MSRSVFIRPTDFFYYTLCIEYNGEVVHESKNCCGKVYYDFFKKEDGSEWVVFGTNAFAGFTLFNLVKRELRRYAYTTIAGRFCFKYIKANETGEYLFCVTSNLDFDFIDLRSVVDPTYMSINDSSDRWYSGEGDFYTGEENNILLEWMVERVEWLSEYIFIFRNAMYNLIFTIIDGNLYLEWHNTTLFEKLQHSLKLHEK